MAVTLFAVGGVLPAARVPLITGVIALSCIYPPAIGRAHTRWMDLALVACLAAIALQLVPVPLGVRGRLSPSAAAIDRGLLLVQPTGAAPLSLHASATASALLIGSVLVLLFWSARSLFGSGGIRFVARGVAWTGLALAVFAIVQHGTAPSMMYWLWRPPGLSPRPFGPFVNRNFLASWVIMAAPLAVGYAVARAQSTRDSGGGTRVASTVDEVMVRLTVAAFLMVAALLVAASRSGMAGLGAGLALFLWLSRRRMRAGELKWLAAAIAVALIAGVSYVLDGGALVSRMDQTIREGLGGRRIIWAETWPMARDFWRTGIGVGAYQHAMLVYQQSPRETFFNHAHNEYLQLAVEGGLLLGVPAILAIVAFGRDAWIALRADASPIYWVRAGAIAGLVAVAVQSVWDVGLRVPANAVLCAILAAIAVHQPARSRRERSSDPATDAIFLDEEARVSAIAARP
jgi:O-antigen ligase